VEVGQVKGIDLRDDRARVTLSIRKGVSIYRDAKFTVGATGIIGSKYLEIEQGRRQTGVIESGEEITGVEPVDLQKAMSKALESLQAMLNDLTSEGPRGSLTHNLRDTVANVRELTGQLNDLIETTKPSIEKALSRADSISDKLDQLLTKSNQMMAGLATDKGAIGALLHDPKIKEDVKETLTSVKEAAATAKDVFGRINQFRIYWNYDWRYEQQIRTSRVDIGLKISPRDGRYYYVGGANLANVVDAPKYKPDYAQRNRVDALMGWYGDYYDFGIGVVHSGGGARVTLTPFYKDPIGKRFSLMAQAYDFGRNRVIEGKLFNKPVYDLGVMARISKFVGIGARVEDMAMTRRYQSWLHVDFEDQDIAYLFGMATFGAAGTKGRSKSK
jgi:phospholipid/cholesterol/gamma-HCH transport system substrate-binding protein